MEFVFWSTEVDCEIEGTGADAGPKASVFDWAGPGAGPLCNNLLSGLSAKTMVLCSACKSVTKVRITVVNVSTCLPLVISARRLPRAHSTLRRSSLRRRCQCASTIRQQTKVQLKSLWKVTFERVNLLANSQNETHP